MIINAVHPEEFRLAIVEGQTLEGFFIETAARSKTVGNIYKGIITHVQTSLQAAFVNYGRERNGFLPFPEIHPEYYVREVGGSPRIQDVIETGQEVLVQVVKEEVGNKGALLTTYISLAGRDLVLMPGQNQRGVSRKIEDESQRERLKELAQGLKVPEDMGIIIRTVAESRTKKEVSKDLEHLLKIWEEIRKMAGEAPTPALIYKEQDLAIRVIRDYYTPNIKSIQVDDRDVGQRVKEFLRIISPKSERTVKFHKDEAPIFNRFNLEDQIEQIFRNKVPLKSGGHLMIDSTEALVAIDVNSGRTSSDGALEETVFKANMEAAAEIPRQLRLRDLGGLIVIDFIDMRDSRHARDVERRLKEEIKKDKAKITVGRISKFGLLELSRQHLGLNIIRGTYKECPMCLGTGFVRSVEATALGYFRKIWTGLVQKKAATVKGLFSVDVANYLLNQKRADLVALEQNHHAVIAIEGSSSLLPHEGHIEFTPRETPALQPAALPPTAAASASPTPPALTQVEESESEPQKDKRKGKGKGKEKEPEKETDQGKAVPATATNGPKRRKRSGSRRKGHPGRREKEGAEGEVAAAESQAGAPLPEGAAQEIEITQHTHDEGEVGAEE